MKVRIAGVLLLMSASCAAPPPPAPFRDSIDELARRALASGKHMGLVVGVLKDGEAATWGYGRRSVDDPRPPDGRSVFEIGSVTKALTGILLALAVERGDLALDDPARKHLPESLSLPSREGKEITLAHLATHTSGLPRLPSNLAPADPANPYADYTVERLAKFLSGHKLRRDPGLTYEYSNLGAGLLGHLLAIESHLTYEQLVGCRICDALDLRDTRITLTDSMKSRLVPGHDEKLRRVPNWDIPALAGAGALRSTADDMLAFLAANLNLKPGPLQKAMALSQVPRADADGGGTRIGLGWHVTPLPMSKRTMVWHNGGTGGYSSFAGFVPETRTAVVVLSNTTESIDFAAMMALEILNR